MDDDVRKLVEESVTLALGYDNVQFPYLVLVVSVAGGVVLGIGEKCSYSAMLSLER